MLEIYPTPSEISLTSKKYGRMGLGGSGDSAFSSQCKYCQLPSKCLDFSICYNNRVWKSALIMLKYCRQAF